MRASILREWLHIPIFVPSTCILYSARQKGEDISKLAESLADKMLITSNESIFLYFSFRIRERNSYQ